MLLLIDIGNTNISYGLAEGNRIVKTGKMPTRHIVAKPKAVRRTFTALKRQSVTSIIICSVAPQATYKLSRLIQDVFQRKPLIVGEDIRVPLKSRYRSTQIGQDRLVGAYAAASLYPAPLIVIDFGTAVTFDVISKNETYLGGIITAGIDMSLESLASQTALLPKIKISHLPKSLIGTDTYGSIVSGVFFGLGSLCDGLVARIKRKIGPCLVVATGGNAAHIKRYCSSIDIINSNLTLIGLMLLYRRSLKHV